ncbi:hypothetical protein Y1Q_0005869 [Alligator mississippiensis]|uniref:Uncharacterized protein n=1 Tax=Alligator mississippiensis TaxID=8496 RepID=A0A151P4S8_ALLMI|nr:hypothetical protein Y1Q_0005869 [Alligator mississippiensis]
MPGSRRSSCSRSPEKSNLHGAKLPALPRLCNPSSPSCCSHLLLRLAAAPPCIPACVVTSWKELGLHSAEHDSGWTRCTRPHCSLSRL